ncbi:YtxH domain-containing protein [Anoxybacillus sp.]|uniref:YtxH domain-containing protein n=1 Tax=Anoxybacillus sp. TaxID=1872573 RepID=UPI0026129D6F|nr:YtxH domain-containing protein [uncultured Anoxybacillus sp.]
MSKNHSFLLGAIVGGIAGAATALFLSSEKGKQLLNESTVRGKQILHDLSEMKNSTINEQKNESSRIEQEEQKPFSSIPIPLPSSDVEQLLKETEQAVDDVEKRLNRGTDAYGEN